MLNPYPQTQQQTHWGRSDLSANSPGSRQEILKQQWAAGWIGLSVPSPLLIMKLTSQVAHLNP